MPVLVTCKSEEDPIKAEGAIESTIFLRCSRVGNSEVNTKVDVTRIRTPLRIYTCPGYQQV